MSRMRTSITAACVAFLFAACSSGPAATGGFSGSSSANSGGTSGDNSGDTSGDNSGGLRAQGLYLSVAHPDGMANCSFLPPIETT